METVIHLARIYAGSLPVALIMALIAKTWMKSISLKRMLGLGLYFNFLPILVAVFWLIVA